MHWQASSERQASSQMEAEEQDQSGAGAERWGLSLGVPGYLGQFELEKWGEGSGWHNGCLVEQLSLLWLS